MKVSRHQKILEIIKYHEISTQEGILEKLCEAGFDVTQATVSRDIKQLHLTKRATASGKYVYTVQEPKTTPSNMKFKILVQEAVLSTDYAGNTAVIRCHVGMGNAVCATLDRMDWNGVVGTLAGDDTIFVLLRTEEKAREYTEMIEQLLQE